MNNETTASDAGMTGEQFDDYFERSLDGMAATEAAAASAKRCDDARDAARYRWVRTNLEPVLDMGGEDLDVYVDAEIAKAPAGLT